MAETVLQAIIISISDYNIYDQIINVILPSNLKKGLICLGTKKILSKNARHISLLNEVEMEVFLSGNDNKLSKLKKILTTQPFSWEFLNYNSVNILLKYLNKSDTFNEDFYSFILILKKEISNNVLDKILLAKTYRIIFNDLGLKFNFKCCVDCGSSHIFTISITKSGLICKNCNTNKETIYPLWFIKNFFYFMHNENKINFISNNQMLFFYDHLNEILSKLIENNAGFK